MSIFIWVLAVRPKPCWQRRESNVWAATCNAKCGPAMRRNEKTSSTHGYKKDLDRIFSADDLANGQNILFCATGISDSALLRGVRAHGGVTAVTHSILMRAKSKTVRFIRARHNLQMKTIRLRSDNREHRI